jgi:hypothetical protein
MKGEIISLEKVMLADCSWCYEGIIRFEDKPNLKLGKCEINNGGK